MFEINKKTEVLLSTYDYVGFDFDDTLVDSGREKSELMQKHISKYFNPNCNVEIPSPMTRESTYNFFAHFEESSKATKEQFLAQLHSDMLQLYKSLRIDIAIRNFVSSSKATIEIISAGNQLEILACLECNSINNVNVITTGFDKSPVLLERSQKYNRVLFVGDSENDKKSAEIAGVDFLEV